MENETKPVEAVTTPSEAPQTQPNETVATPVVEQPQEAVMDYEKLYEESKKKLEQAEFSLYRKKKAEKLARQQQQETGFVDREEVMKEVHDEVATLVSAQREKDSEDLIEETIMDLSNDPAERKLIRFEYDNRINKTGFSRLAIREDLEDARLLANKVKYRKERQELTRAAISKQTITNSGAGTNLDKPVATEDFSKVFSSQDWDFMQKRKWSPEQIKKAAQALKK